MYLTVGRRVTVPDRARENLFLFVYGRDLLLPAQTTHGVHRASHGRGQGVYVFPVVSEIRTGVTVAQVELIWDLFRATIVIEEPDTEPPLGAISPDSAGHRSRPAQMDSQRLPAGTAQGTTGEE